MTYTVFSVLAVMVSFMIPAVGFNYALTQINPLCSPEQTRRCVLRIGTLAVLTITFLLGISFAGFSGFSTGENPAGPVGAALVVLVVPALLGGLWKAAVTRGRAAE